MEKQLIFCKSGGCTAKLGPSVLSKVLSMLPRKEDPNLLVGYDSNDDAAVYQISEDTAIVSTLDFFPPMVKDPYLFGQIAAANAMSDIYAMGGNVISALNIVCFPEQEDLNLLGEILRGGSEKVMEAGAVLAGGHSIADEGIKYGLAVTGLINPNMVLQNNRCQKGDLLLLTKPLGVGIVCTAMNLGHADEAAFELVMNSMTTLNKQAMDLLKRYELHACTDITGFGFLVHLCEMLGTEFSANVYKDHIPYIKEAKEYAEEFYITAAGQRNRNHVQNQVEFINCSFALEEILYDPQTSGGLLVSIKKEDAMNALAQLKLLGLPCDIVGQVIPKQTKTVMIQ